MELIAVELVRMQMFWSEGIGILRGKREACWDGWRDGSYADLFLVWILRGGFVGMRIDLAGCAYCWIGAHCWIRDRYWICGTLGCWRVDLRSRDDGFEFDLGHDAMDCEFRGDSTWIFHPIRNPLGQGDVGGFCSFLSWGGR